MILGELKKGTPGRWGTFVGAMWALGGRRGYILSWASSVFGEPGDVLGSKCALS